MRRAFAALTLVAAVLAGCGTQPSPNANLAAQAALAAQAKKKKAVKVDQAAFEKGQAAAAERFSTTKRQGLGDGDPSVTPAGVDGFSYQYGYALGLLNGALITFSRIDGSFDVYEWKNFAYVLHGAMKDALAAIKGEPTLAQKAAITAGILEGGIRSFNAINGSFDVYQWKSFAYSNKAVLDSAVQSLRAIQP